MSQPTTTTTTTTNLTTKYASPANAAFAIDTPLPSPGDGNVGDKTAYLAALRTAVADAQATINKELTARMDEDKARDAAAGGGAGPAASVDDVKEEENYGEEVQEEEED
ncbi:hypothetical protein V2A60_001270 [Cordyceps javanica]|uniref:EKC/KEOPS complex subunit GON7 n=1 Tax=Cordyceps javanica TaxID=43265 RepID=A0A545WBJ9_9HYPO|nr:gon7 family domain-containing protein [Cordyceps javanica]TQW11360.1 gon7 family domain-containing protein [Cordyceps javanica]